MKRSLGGRLNQAAAWIILLLLIIPSLVSFPVSVTSKTYLSFPWEGVSWQHFRNLLTSPEWLSSFGQSAIIAVLSALIATASGTLCAIGLWRISSRFGEAVRAFLLLPLMVPPIISAMAFYRWWIPLGLIDSYLGIIIAHAILALPLVLITVSASLANFDPRLEQASRSLGASMSTTVWRVILPVIKPGIAAGAVFAFILSWDEIVVTLFISKFDVFTLPRRLWNGMRENTDPTVAAAAVVLILITLAALVIFNLTSRRRGDDTA
ncbi:ABC transporter permease [Aestuariivirga sp.]|uniref:ABC transporter permease n=1 Tax=Aestuariivirga sp. TaxID=2650926 RepID=UPI003592EFC8